MKKTYQLVAIVACALAICSCEKQGPSVISSSEVTPLENSAVASRAEFSSLLEMVFTQYYTRYYGGKNEMRIYYYDVDSFK